MLRFVLRGVTRWGAVALERDEYSISNYGCRSDIYCFNKKGGTIKSISRMTYRVLMMADKTNGAVVVGNRVIMVMEHHNESGQQKKQYEKFGKAFMPLHMIPFTPAQRLISVNEIVKVFLNARYHLGPHLEC